MRSDEMQALGTLTSEAIEGGTRRIEETHRAIADRAFGASGPGAKPAQALHDAIAGTVYRSVRTVGSALARVGGEVGALRVGDGGAPLAASARGNALQAALNGAFGDTVHERHRPLSVRTAIRRGGRDVPCEREALRVAFPQATNRVVVFLHGLGESERSWNRRGEAHGRGLRASYGTLLEEDLGVTSVRLRMNTGRHISENGAELAALLDELRDAWPVPLRELSFVGHSMGGLIVRSACHQAIRDDRDWTGLVRHVVCLGSPHLGAPLERATNGATWALAQLPETRPLAKVINARAVGVKDLRYGALCEEHWLGRDADALWHDATADVDELHGGATHFSVSANLGATEDHLLGRLFGDILVPATSAAGTGHKTRRPLVFDGARHFPGLSHFDLLNHPAVYAQLRDWLTPVPRQLPAGPTLALTP